MLHHDKSLHVFGLGLMICFSVVTVFRTDYRTPKCFFLCVALANLPEFETPCYSLYFGKKTPSQAAATVPQATLGHPDSVSIDETVGTSQVSEILRSNARNGTVGFFFRLENQVGKTNWTTSQLLHQWLFMSYSWLHLLFVIKTIQLLSIKSRTCLIPSVWIRNLRPGRL